MQLTFSTRAYALRVPVRAAWGTLERREVVEVEIRTGDGRTGRGEAAPLEPYDGVPLAAVMAALDAYSAVLRVLPERTPHADVLDACASERALPQALAAIDLALWDIDGRRAGRAASHLIAAGAAASVPVNATIGAEDRTGAAAEATRAVAAGHRALKVKVGVGDDAGRVAAVRAAVGADVVIRVDANGAWRTPAEALANLERLAPAGIELCEEPVHGLDGLAAVRDASPIPIAADEAAEPGAGVTDAVALKLSRSGGITGVLRDARLAREAGSRVYLTSTFDGPVGIAGALQAASALAATGELLPCGLATLGALEGCAAHPVRDGRIELPPGEGVPT